MWIFDVFGAVWGAITGSRGDMPGTNEGAGITHDG